MIDFAQVAQVLDFFWGAFVVLVAGAAPFICRRWGQGVQVERVGVDCYVRFAHHVDLLGREPLAGNLLRGGWRGRWDRRVAATQDGFLGHLGELRWLLRRVLLWVAVAFFFLPMMLGMFSFMREGKLSLGTAWRWFFEGAGDIYGFLATPLLENLPESGEIIAIGVGSPILVPMKAAFFLAVCVMMPYILYEVWKFVAEGLYPWYDDVKKRLVYDENGAEEGRNEKRLGLGLIVSSAGLFYVGMAFAYILVFQVVFGVIATVTPDTVNWTPDIGELFGAMLLMFFSFGLVFEIPVAMYILARMGVVEPEDMRKARPYVIVGAFVVAAVVTPPDIWSQIIFAVLCWLLYEFGLWITSKWGVKKEKPKTAAAD